MSEPLRLGRYKLLLDEISARTAGCTISQLWIIAQDRYRDQWSNQITLRRDMDDLVAVGWLEKTGANYYIAPALGEYWFRRFQTVAERASQPLREMQDMFTRIGRTLPTNRREEEDEQK